MAETAEFPAHRPRRRRGGWPVLLAIGLVLVAIVVVGDRVAATYATRELRAQLVAELSNRGVEFQTAEVTVGGFPFLTQVGQGKYDEITIEMSDVRLPAESGLSASLPELRVVATGVVADTADLMQGTAAVTAQQVTGTAILSFRTLLEFIDFSQYNLTDVVVSESSGGLRVSGRTMFAGMEIPVSATADVAVEQGRIQFTLRDAQAVNMPVPPVVRDYLAGLAERSASARLPQLPFSLTLEKVTVLADGLAITATGRDVPLVA